MAESVSSLLRRSIGHLADEVPAGYRHVLDALGALVVGLEVGDEHCTLRGGRRLEVTEGVEEGAGTRVTTSRTTILAILDAAITLDDAIETGALDVRGALDDVLRAHDTLRAYVHAAVRAPSQPGLLDALRADTP